MTLAPFRSPAADTGWVERMRAVLEVDPDAVSEGQARESIRLIGQLEAQLTARKLRFARRLERAGTANAVGATSTGSLVAGDFGGNRTAGDRLVRAAEALESASLTETALSAGEISFEQAEIVGHAVAGLPHHLSELDRARVERRLISDAKLHSVRDLRRRVMRIADLYADKPAADVDENEKLRLQEARAWANTELWMSPARDGLVAFGGKIPEAQADILKAGLDACAAPRRNIDEESTYSQRLGRAFCTWIEHLPTDGFPTTGGTPAHVTINLDLADLEHRIETAAPGSLSTGTRLSAGETRRLACSLGVIPKVLNTQSVVVDQGRSQRLFTPAQRTALAERDHGCTFPGCDRPPGWCEAHHMDHWARDDGPTTLTNGALLCAFHHREVHAKNLPMQLRDNSVHIRIHDIWQRNRRWRP